MHLVVGLGNPGRQYDGTRHNVGFEVIDALAQRWRFPAEREDQRAFVTKGSIGTMPVLLVKPQTYMNLSGEPTGALARYYKVQTPQIIVVHDELDFAPGDIRLKPNGGHGGHNGLRSMIAQVGADFVRVRVGIGKPHPKIDGASWVLGRFTGHERQLMDDAVIKACETVECVLRDGLQKAMNQVNQKE